MTALLLAAAVLTLRLPYALADSGACGGTRPLTDLDSLFVYISTASIPHMLAFAGPEHGREGEYVDISLPSGWTATWAETNRIGRPKHSCASPYLGANLGVPHGPRVKLPEQWIAVTGQVLKHEPTTPGWYIYRAPDGTVRKWPVVR